MKKPNVLSLLIAFLFVFRLNAQEVKLNLPEMTVDPDDIFSVNVTASDFDNIASMQFAIFWNPEIIKFKSISNLNINMPEFYATENFNNLNAEDGRLKVVWSWFDPATSQGVTLDNNSTLFSIIFEAVGGQGTNTMLEIAADTTVEPPFIVEFGNFDEVIDVAVDNGKITLSGVNASKETITEDFVLFQNNPNPFTDLTYISFNLNEGSATKLTIFDNSGKLVYQQNKYFPAGLSRIPVRRDMLNSAGSYFYTLETTRATATRQLIMQ